MPPLKQPPFIPFEDLMTSADGSVLQVNHGGTRGTGSIDSICNIPLGFRNPEYRGGLAVAYCSSGVGPGFASSGPTIRVALHKPVQHLDELREGWRECDIIPGIDFNPGTGNFGEGRASCLLSAQKYGDSIYGVVGLVRAYTDWSYLFRINFNEFSEQLYKRVYYLEWPSRGSMFTAGERRENGRLHVSDTVPPKLWYLDGEESFYFIDEGVDLGDQQFQVDFFSDYTGEWRGVNPNAGRHFVGTGWAGYMQVDQLLWGRVRTGDKTYNPVAGSVVASPRNVGHGPVQAWPWSNGTYGPPDLWYFIAERSYENGPLTGRLIIYKSPFREGMHDTVARPRTVFDGPGPGGSGGSGSDAVFISNSVDYNPSRLGYMKNLDWLSDSHRVGVVGPFPNMVLNDPWNLTPKSNPSVTTIIPANITIERDPKRQGRLYCIVANHVGATTQVTGEFNGIWHSVSDDDGKTWQRPKNIETPIPTASWGMAVGEYVGSTPAGHFPWNFRKLHSGNVLVAPTRLSKAIEVITYPEGTPPEAPPAGVGGSPMPPDTDGRMYPMSAVVTRTIRPVNGFEVQDHWPPPGTPETDDDRRIPEFIDNYDLETLEYLYGSGWVAEYNIGVFFSQGDPGVGFRLWKISEQGGQERITRDTPPDSPLGEQQDITVSQKGLRITTPGATGEVYPGISAEDFYPFEILFFPAPHENERPPTFLPAQSYPYSIQWTAVFKHPIAEENIDLPWSWEVNLGRLLDPGNNNFVQTAVDPDGWTVTPVGVRPAPETPPTRIVYFGWPGWKYIDAINPAFRDSAYDDSAFYQGTGPMTGDAFPGNPITVRRRMLGPAASITVEYEKIGNLKLYANGALVHEDNGSTAATGMVRIPDQPGEWTLVAEVDPAAPGTGARFDAKILSYEPEYGNDGEPLPPKLPIKSIQTRAVQGLIAVEVPAYGDADGSKYPQVWKRGELNRGSWV